MNAHRRHVSPRRRCLVLKTGWITNTSGIPPYREAKPTAALALTHHPQVDQRRLWHPAPSRFRRGPGSAKRRSARPASRTAIGLHYPHFRSPAGPALSTDPEPARPGNEGAVTASPSPSGGRRGRRPGSSDGGRPGTATNRLLDGPAASGRAGGAEADLGLGSFITCGGQVADRAAAYRSTRTPPFAQRSKPRRAERATRSARNAATTGSTRRAQRATAPEQKEPGRPFRPRVAAPSLIQSRDQWRLMRGCDRPREVRFC